MFLLLRIHTNTPYCIMLPAQNILIFQDTPSDDRILFASDHSHDDKTPSILPNFSPAWTPAAPQAGSQRPFPVSPDFPVHLMSDCNMGLAAAVSGPDSDRIRRLCGTFFLLSWKQVSFCTPGFLSALQ